MHFLPDVYVTCDLQGQALQPRDAGGQFKGKSIADVLDMTVEDAQEFFKAVPAMRDKLDALMRVGLGYIKVGQQATTLSGGEAQRVKLAKELSKRSTGRTLYILDEPTTGLHFHDVAKLLEVLHELVEQGNTVVVIEHNLDVIKTADWIIDLGPEGGDGGGEIVGSSARPRTWPASRTLPHRFVDVQVDLTVSDGVLTLKGEKNVSHESKQDHSVVIERNYGSFYRSFPVPDQVDQDEIAAKFDKGVLTVTMPKKPGSAKTERRIKVRS
jgi:ABC-type cobalamin/Fe3+-siderophores transport system ATPase subunit